VTKLRDDDGMRDAFQNLRAETRQGGRAPEFGAMLEEARRQAAARPALEVVHGGGRRTGGAGPARRLMRVGGWASAALAAGIAAVLLVDRPDPTGEEDFERLVAAYAAETSGAAWSSPTSGLLEVPGIDLMRSLPSIGAPVRGMDPSSLPTPSSSVEEENL